MTITPIAVNSRVEFQTQDTNTPPQVIIDGQEYGTANMTCRPVAGYKMCSYDIPDFLISYLNNTPGTHTIKTIQGTTQIPDLTVENESEIPIPPDPILGPCDFAPENSTVMSKMSIGTVLERDDPYPRGQRVKQLQDWGWEVILTTKNQNTCHTIAICRGKKDA